MLSPTSFPTPRVFNSLGLVWSSRRCSSNRFPGENDDARLGITLKTIAQRIPLFCYPIKRTKGQINIHDFNKIFLNKSFATVTSYNIGNNSLGFAPIESLSFLLVFMTEMKENCTYRVKMTYQLQIIFPILFFVIKKFNVARQFLTYSSPSKTRHHLLCIHLISTVTNWSTLRPLIPYTTH